jgi:hypothetical protein
VRLCDGRYFPVQRQTASSSPAKICTAQCPASQTKILTGAGIDNAIGLDGGRYSSLKNAFVYRERVVSDCTCNGKDPYGLAPIAVNSDPTLQRGDIVVTDKGPVAFVGDDRLPHRAAKFAPVKNSPAVSDSLRKQLSSLRVARQSSLELWLPGPLPQSTPASVSEAVPVRLSSPVSFVR